jgi:hypothetical protein
MENRSIINLKVSYEEAIRTMRAIDIYGDTGMTQASNSLVVLASKNNVFQLCILHSFEELTSCVVGDFDDGDHW